MAKKSFKENPALSFISQALAENSAPGHLSSIPTDAYDDIDTSIDVYDDMHTGTSISSSAKQPATVKKRSVPQPDPFPLRQKDESKSRRLQLLIRPSTHEGISTLAKTHHTSVNDVINQILEEYIRRSK